MVNYSMTKKARIHNGGTSLVVQWLRLYDPKAGGLGSTPSQGAQGLQYLQHMCSAVVAHVLSGCGLWVLELKLSPCGAQA